MYVSIIRNIKNLAFASKNDFTETIIDAFEEYFSHILKELLLLNIGKKLWNTL